MFEKTETSGSMPLNLQFFAEPAAPAAESGEGTTPATTEKTDETTKNNDVNLEEIAEKGKAQKEAAIIKSYFQQQGMTKEEAEEAFKSWKDTKAAEAKAAEEAKKAEEDSKLQAIKDAEAKAEAAQKALNNMIIQNSLEREAIALGVDPARLDVALRLTNNNNITITDGKANTDEVKKEIEAVLEILPELKKTQSSSGFNFGAQKQQEATPSQDTKQMTYREKLALSLKSK